jgi:hypothetical protein
MKNFFFLLSVLCLFTVSTNSFSQSQGISYKAVGKGVATTFVTDYQSLGINSSALGWVPEYKGKRFTAGSTEFGLGIYSDSLNVDKLRSLFKTVRSQVNGNNPDTASWQEQRQYATDYLNAGIHMFANFNWGGFAYQSKRLGGFAFNVRENYLWYSRLNSNLTDILFKGKLANYFDSLTIKDLSGNIKVIPNSNSISQDTLGMVVKGTISSPLNISRISSGSQIQFQWNRSYNIGYGRKIFGKDSLFEIYAGIGARYIRSMAMFDMRSDEDGFFVYSSVSPNFNINYDSIVAMLNPSNFTQKGKFFPSVVGSGYGIDLSASAIFFGKIKVAAAVNNIGQVTYRRNVYGVKDTLIGSLEVNGLDEFNITKAVNNFLKDGGLFTLVGQDRHTVINASDFRLGASADLGRFAKIGFDFVAPFNKESPGSLTNSVFSFGGELKLAKWLEISAGYFGGGIYMKNIPFGVNFVFGDGRYEFGASSYDALSFFKKSSNSISGAFGFARVHF